MRWFIISLFMGLSFVGGYRFGNKEIALPPTSEIQNEFVKLSKEDLKDYANLKESRQKYEMANQILAKVVKIFIADLGLKNSPPTCQLDHPSSHTQANPVPPVEPKDPATGPTQTAPSETKDEARSAPIAKEPAKPPKTNPSRSAPSLRYVRRFSPEQARGAMTALYQAVLWRALGSTAAEMAEKNFAEAGWQLYLRKARAIVKSAEFLSEIEPHHTPQQIISRMNAVYRGRCPTAGEMEEFLNILARSGPSEVIATIIQRGRKYYSNEILSGGFNPNSCVN